MSSQDQEGGTSTLVKVILWLLALAVLSAAGWWVYDDVYGSGDQEGTVPNDTSSSSAPTVESVARVVAAACPDCNCGPSTSPDTQVVLTIPEGKVDVGIRFVGNAGPWLPHDFSQTSLKDEHGNVYEIVGVGKLEGPMVFQLSVPPHVKLLSFEVGRQTFTVPASRP